MSGGHWQYLQFKMGDWAHNFRAVWELMAAIEGELDWGICGDTCYECAKNRVVPAIEAFFDEGCEDSTTAVAIMKSNAFPCEKHKPSQNNES